MKIRSKTLTLIAAWFAVRLLKLLFATCRVECILAQPGTNPYEPTADRYLYSIWHDEILMAVFSGKPRKLAGLVSRHRDGGYLAVAMSMCGITPVRGSSKRGGAQAMGEMLEITSTHHIAITSDGPQGPRHEPKQGLVFLASKTGRSIIPTAAVCRRGFRIQGSWTDMLFPYPFTSIFYLAGEPMQIPPELSRPELERYTQLLKERMDEMQERAVDVLAGKAVTFAAPQVASKAA